MENANCKECQPYICEQCNKTFSQRSSRNRHIREQHVQPGFYKCNKCGLSFSKKYNLQMHTKRAHSQDTRKANNAHKCSHCSCIFNRISVLKKHTKDYHEKDLSLQNNTPNQTDLNKTDDNDPRTIAEQVLQELKQLQRDIQPENEDNQFESPADLQIAPSNSSPAEIFAIDAAMVKEITIKDKLYPMAQITKHKVQIIKRSDGCSYYICDYCSKEFKKTYDYLRHRRIHTKVRPFQCVLCKKSFPTRAQLKSHSLSHKLHEKFGILKRFYKCPKCNEGFTSIRQLDQHFSSYVECRFSFECPECLKSFKSLKSLFRHKHYSEDTELNLLKTLLPLPISLKDEEENVLRPAGLKGKLRPTDCVCSLCGLKLSSKLKLEQHEQRHQNSFKYQCNICRGFYISKASLNVHKKRHLHQNKFNCRLCSKNFYNNYQLQRHQLTHALHKNFKCPYCEKTFKTSQNCRSHMITHLKKLLQTNETTTIKDEQETLNKYTTIIEDFSKTKVFTTTLQIIRATKSGVVKKVDNELEQLKYKCLSCQKSFRYAAWLKKHFKYKHTNDRPYECEYCRKNFRTKQVLQTHRTLHAATSKAKVTCQVCGKQYASEKSLKLHLRIHTEEKPFKCVICNKEFRTSGHLIQHQKSNHIEKKVQV